MVWTLVKRFDLSLQGQNQMQYTNRHNLPKPIYDAILNHGYDNPDGYSVSKLISPAYQGRLLKEYRSEITADISDSIWALLGTSVHSIIEKAGTDIVKELRVYKQFDHALVSGKADYYDPVNKELLDFKVTSKYATQYGKVKPEWEQQLNILAYLFEEIGLAVNSLGILAILRDWSKPDRMRHEFSDVPFIKLSVEKWDKEKARMFILKRVEAHQYAETVPITIQTPCSEEERWKSENVFAIKKNGSVRATKLCETYDEALLYCADKGLSVGESAKQYSVEERPGLDRRCMDYCAVKKYCSHAIACGY